LPDPEPDQAGGDDRTPFALGAAPETCHRRSKSVHQTLTYVLEGRGNVHCGGIFRDPRLAPLGAEGNVSDLL